MTEERKPKVEAGKPRVNRAFVKNEVFKAPMSGLETVIFDYGLPKHTTNFTNAIKELSRHVAVNFKYAGLSMARAMTTLEKPDLDLLVDLPDTPTPSAMQLFMWQRLYQSREIPKRDFTEANQKA